MRIKSARKRRDLPVIFLKIALVVAVFSLGIKVFDTRIRPTVSATLLTSAKAQTLSALNEAVEKSLSEFEFDFSNAVEIVNKQDGTVSMVKTNALLINLFQTRISERLNTRVKEFCLKEHRIAIGSLSGMVLFNGRGVKIPFYLSPLSQVKTELESEFLSAGINQTIHKINLKVSVGIRAVIPGFSDETSVSADYCVAQTVIVGDVPQLMLGSQALK
jgi:sporulation protein YunB